MKYDILVPEFAEGAEEINLRQWFVQVGDVVTKDSNVAEIATDKIAAYIEAPADGTVVEILAEERDRVKVGEVIGRLEG